MVRRILGRGPHTVVVRPAILGARDSGNNKKLAYGPPVTFSGCSVQFSGESGAGSMEQKQDSEMKLVIGVGNWPGGPHSKVTFEGEDYDQLGVAQVFDMGFRTKHFNVIIRRSFAPLMERYGYTKR